MHLRLIFLLIIFSFQISAQETDKDQEIQQELSEMDSISPEELSVFDTIQLNDADMIHLVLDTEMEKKYYLWLRKRVREVWPYVKVAVEEYNSIEDTTKYFDSKRQKRKYVKKRQELLADKFEEKLKNLSLSRGQILIKLIHRETGKTTYDIIKELRGGVNAFIWNSAGGAFDLDLKTEFSPYKTREDMYIQVILEKDFRSGRLEPIQDMEKRD
jgi:hypothetical protein